MFAAACCLLACIPQQPVDAAAVTDIVQAWAKAGQFRGVALVAREGKELARVAVGEAERSWGVPLSTDAVFPIASLTKQFTAVLTFQAVERGELSLGSTLAVLPGFAEAPGREVRVEHLLLHSGGFRDPDFAHYLDPRRVGVTDLQIAREYLAGQKPDFEPGTQFRYSNADYHLLGAMLEHATGKPFAQLVAERIAKPLGLQHTQLADRGAVRKARPGDYVATDAGGWRRPAPFQWSNWQAAGGLESSLDDLHRWNQGLVSHELITAESTKSMLTVPEQPGNYVAHGSWVYGRKLPGTDVSMQLVERRGAIGGHAVLNAFDPQRREWVILYSNHGDRTLDTLAYAPCLPLDLFSVLHGGETTRGR